MEKITDKMTFSNIEKLFMIVMVALFIIAGITVFSLTTRKKNITNFKEDTAHIISIAKNAYSSLDMKNSNKIVKSTDGRVKGMCITIKGLQENEFLTNEYKDWDGYIVVEETANRDFNYSIWVSNGKYVIDGYDSEKIIDLDFNDGIVKANKDSFSSKVKTSFTGTSGDKGGTGSSDGSTVTRFEAACINEKVE